MRTTLVQFAPRLNRNNLDNICKIIENNISKSDLIVFPELSLNGYLLQDKLREDAYELNELTTLCELSQEIDIVVGAAIKDNGFYRNASLYFSNGSLLSKHFKVHLPNYGMFEEARYFQPGDIFESFETSFGKVSMLVCEDLWHKSVHEDLIKENPDIIIAVVASPARGFSDNGLEIQKKWYEIIKVVAKECSAKLVFINRVGFEDGLGFWGGSCIVDADANIIEKMPLFKEDIKTFQI